MNPRFQLDPDAPLRRYAIAGPAAASLVRDAGVRHVDPLNPDDRAFCVAVNRANCLAHDGVPHPGSGAAALGMPPWVMLDCCALPSAVFGYETPASWVPEPLRQALDPDGVLPWIPVSEYIALPSLDPDELVGVSLFSLPTGAGLGTRTKALALRVLGRPKQIGITQWSSPGVRLHLAFGPLRVKAPTVAIHSKPNETFVYELAVPGVARLEAIEGGARWQPDGPSPDDVQVDPRSADVSALASRLGDVSVVDTGAVVAGKLSSITLRPV